MARAWSVWIATSQWAQRIAFGVAVSATVTAVAATLVVGRIREQAEHTDLQTWPAFRGIDQQGLPIDNGSLSGHPWIASFIFTRCTTACPVISARLRLLQRRIATPDVRFVSFTVDPEFDTDQVLRDYAARWSPDPRWRLVWTKGDTVDRMAAGLNLAIDREPGAPDPILHTSRLFLVDGEGRVTGSYDASEPEAMDRLVRDVEAESRESIAGMNGSKPSHAAAASSPAGHDLFRELGCPGCHSDLRTAPSLVGLFGTDVVLDDGSRVRADEAYVRNAILHPKAQVVAGYLPTMPSYASLLSEGDVNELVAHVRSLAQEGAPPKVAARSAIDPVCNMAVPVVDGALTARFAGKSYYFCSDRCRQRFLSAPEKYRDAN